jgi:hypothetical protein
VNLDFEASNHTLSGTKVHKLLDFDNDEANPNSTMPLSSSLSQKFGEFLNNQANPNSFKKLTYERTSFRDVEWQII